MSNEDSKTFFFLSFNKRFLLPLQRALQYFTSSQLLRHFFLYKKGKPHVLHNFLGRWDLFFKRVICVECNKLNCKPEAGAIPDLRNMTIIILNTSSFLFDVNRLPQLYKNKYLSLRVRLRLRSHSRLFFSFQHIVSH